MLPKINSLKNIHPSKDVSCINSLFLIIKYAFILWDSVFSSWPNNIFCTAKIEALSPGFCCEALFSCLWAHRQASPLRHDRNSLREGRTWWSSLIQRVWSRRVQSCAFRQTNAKMGAEREAVLLFVEDGEKGNVLSKKKKKSEHVPRPVSCNLFF